MIYTEKYKAGSSTKFLFVLELLCKRGEKTAIAACTKCISTGVSIYVRSYAISFWAVEKKVLGVTQDLAKQNGVQLVYIFFEHPWISSHTES